MNYLLNFVTEREVNSKLTFFTWHPKVLNVPSYNVRVIFLDNQESRVGIYTAYKSEQFHVWMAYILLYRTRFFRFRLSWSYNLSFLRQHLGI